MHVRQYLTRTLEQMVKVTGVWRGWNSRVCADPEVPGKGDSDASIGRGDGRKRRIWI